MRTGHEMREAYLGLIHEDALALVTTPTPPKSVWEIITALGKALEAYEALVLAYSTSSSPKYAFSDLPFGEKSDYEQTKHALRVLTQLYSPVREG